MKYLKLKIFIAFQAVLFLAFLPLANAHEIMFGNLHIHHPWVRVSPANAKVMAGYMIIMNMGAEDDRLVAATGEIAKTVTLHTVKMQGAVVKMEEMKDGIAIPAGATVELKPKSLHVMFSDLTTEPMEGQVFKGTLTFAKAGTVDVEYEVTNPDAGMN